MAVPLSRIYGTEQDKVNCPFYYKMGACRHGDRCSRQHNRPTESQTVMLQNMYQTPFNQYNQNGDPLFNLEEAQRHFEEFYEDIFVEMSKFGEVEDINVCANLGEHLTGNVYIKFADEENATTAMLSVKGRFYAGKSLNAELSPVTDFREARCRQYGMGECRRGGYCNFMHLREPSRALGKKLQDWQREEMRKLGKVPAADTRSPKKVSRSPPRSRDRREVDDRPRGGYDKDHRPRADERKEFYGRRDDTRDSYSRPPPRDDYRRDDRRDDRPRDDYRRPPPQDDYRRPDDRDRGRGRTPSPPPRHRHDDRPPARGARDDSDLYAAAGVVDAGYPPAHHPPPAAYHMPPVHPGGHYTSPHHPPAHYPPPAEYRAPDSGIAPPRY